jgi:23S rRNA (adenine-N6)-dimethyltransferase
VHDAGIGPHDLVVEIGAGTGRLTHELARRAGRVVAVELDPAFVERLRRAFAEHPQVEIVRGDILSVGLPAIPYRAFGNIPFGSTNAILRRLLDDVGGALVGGELLIQLEAARKRTSVWPSTLLSLGWFPWWELTLTRRIPRHGFEPPPSVDAGVLRIARRDPPLLPPEIRPDYVSLLRRAFVRPTWPVGRAIPDEITSMAWKRFARARGHTPQATPRDLDVADWVALFKRSEGQR